MNLRISIDRSSNKQLARKPVGEPGSMLCASGVQQISTPFSSYLGELGMSAISKQRARPVPAPPNDRRPAMAHTGPLGRALSWLNSRCSVPKQLRVLETVTLGDKRLVAVIQADGRRFLVGGGPSGVSLLTQLDQMQKPRDDFDSSAGLTELAG
jgi:hypothetical protein